MADRRDARKLPALVAGIKLEPGTFDAPPGRLPSFGGRRDLTLGSSGIGKLGQGLETKPKRVYTPNLNVQRNKNKSETAVKDEHPNNKEKRDRNKNDGKGRKQDRKNNLIQMGGVFSEGVAGKSKASGGRCGGGGGGGGDRDPCNSFIQKPKLNLQHDKKIDKEEEEMKLKELLRDNLIDDPGMEPDLLNAPVKLPMFSLAKIKTEVKVEGEEDTKSSTVEVHGVKIKQEKVDEEEKDVKPRLENGAMKEEPAAAPETVKMRLPEDLEVRELFESKDPQLIFLQLPDSLPGLKPEIETVPARPSATAKPSTSVTDQANSTTSENTEVPKHCSLRTLTEGCIGRLQILKSGRARLVLGDVVMNMDMGTQVAFKQDLISVNLDHSSKGGDMINLGAVNARMVCTPDWESMLTRKIK